jgi:hypothetical protein
MYALAAVVIGLLAFAPPSEAKIVYTPTHVVIVDSSYNLDLNRDRTTDFTIQQINGSSRCYNNPPAKTAGLGLNLAPGNGAAFICCNRGFAALARGVEIGPEQNFEFDNSYMAFVRSGFFHGEFGACEDRHDIVGDWVNVSNRYLGLVFQIKGKTHYGWARLSVQVGYVYINAALTGYAYETITGKSIKAGQKTEADDFTINPDSLNRDDFGPGGFLTSPVPDLPQPASLGMLALGAQGVPMWRRKESAALEGNLKGALL